MSKAKHLPTGHAHPASSASDAHGVDRPHPHVRFELVAIDRLLPHEEVQEAVLRKVKEDVEREGALREPILVADEHYVVLNGHHRLAALRALGVKRVPAWVVAYFSDVVELDRWPEATHGHPVSKEHVVERARKRKLYPPKTTRHQLRVDLPEKSTDLADLQ